MEVKSLEEITLTNVDLLLLDLDNTLYEYQRCHLFALQKLTEKFVELFNLTVEEVDRLYHGSRKAVHDTHLGTANAHSRLFYIQRMVEKTTGTTNTAVILQLYHIYWDSYINHMELYHDSISLLDRCQSQGIIMVMVTDMLTDIQYKKIKTLGIGSYFNYVVTSEEAGVEKPHPYIFELAISKGLLVNPNLKNIAIIGDNVKKDVYSSGIYHTEVYHILRDE